MDLETPTKIEPLEQTVSPQIVRAETNFLRFPLFALGTKNLKQIDFREYQGTRKIKTKTGEAQKVAFTYRVSRNTDQQYPGPLARKIHFALLAMMQRQPHPYQNPVKFKWRELAREMGISFSGNKVQRMKNAIKSIHGVLIHSEHALIDGDSRNAVRRERGLHLYSQYIFQSELLPDGEIADRNYVYFADWYLNNLNAFYSVRMDYELWKRLNQESPIASRLYEFLTHLFGSQNVRRIGYRKLARCLPVEEHKRPSHAVKQFDSSLRLLVKEGIISSFAWKRGVEDLNLELRRCQKKTTSQVADHFGEDEEITSATESASQTSPSEKLLQDFYRRWLKIENPILSEKDLKLAKELVEIYGYETLNSVLRKVISTLRVSFPDARSFSAAQRIFEQLASKAKTNQADSSNVAPNEQADEESQKQKAKNRERMKQRWQNLSARQKAEIESTVRNRSRSRKPKPSVFELHCLMEMELRRHNNLSSES
ncbi:MAG: hypothetical protein AAFN77_18310 [Planctomycetota bacterium]